MRTFRRSSAKRRPVLVRACGVKAEASKLDDEIGCHGAGRSKTEHQDTPSSNDADHGLFKLFRSKGAAEVFKGLEMDLERRLEGCGQAIANFAQGSSQPLGRRQRSAQFIGESASHFVKPGEAQRLGCAHDRCVAGFRLPRQCGGGGDEDLLAVLLKEPHDPLLGGAHSLETVCNSLIEARHCLNRSILTHVAFTTILMP